MLEWQVTDNPQEEDIAVVFDGVFSFGRAQARAGNAKEIACFVRQNGVVIAGASGRTEFNRLFVSLLWVSEPLRHQGLAKRLLATLESHAIERGCTSAMIETLLEPAALLYRSQGYSVTAEVPECVGPFTRYIMLKRFNSGHAASSA
jgi:ribosomal protein S18 acetylase RimI-like enzyme